MPIEPGSDKTPQTTVAFEATITFGSSFEVGPLSLKPIVVDSLERIPVPSDVSYMPFFGLIFEVVKGTRVTVQAVGNDIGLSQRR